MPGPCKAVLGGASCFIAIAPAFWPFPYSFVSFEDAAACVSCAVSFDGFMPSVGGAAGAAGADATPCSAAGAAAGASFFTCPGALAELPGAPSPELPLPFPFPLPAVAEPANTKTQRTSTHVPASRIVILPFPATHVSEEEVFVQSRRKKKGGPEAALRPVERLWT
ncbi:MAG: hypothetical protein ACJ74B_08545 [Gaiellaceae bacterium]